jgi:Predicted membrane protein
MTDDPRPAQLRRMKAIALGMLLAMVAGFVLAHAMGNAGIWAWVSAFCEAATVGALADWFAVVALFRHPLGLPFPHTAIIPRGKARIGDSLAVFVRDHFLEPQALLAKLEVFDPAARLGQWLARPEQAARLAQAARGWMVQALDMLDERAVREGIQRFVVGRLRAWDAAATAGEVLDLLTADGRHQELLDEALRRLARWLDDDAVKRRASALLVKHARREWPRLVGTVDWVKPVEGIADSLAERIAHALMAELNEILSQPEHPLRRDYERWLQDYMARLRSDPALATQVDRIKQQLIDHPSVQAYVQGLWDQIHAALRRDLERGDSAIARHLEQTLAGLGQALGRDPELRTAINQHVLAGAEKLAGRLRGGVTEHIAQTVKGWDERHLVRQLELSVGRDLQYIRFNGTLVGGLIGVLLHAAITLLPW